MDTWMEVVLQAVDEARLECTAAFNSQTAELKKVIEGSDADLGEKLGRADYRLKAYRMAIVLGLICAGLGLIFEPPSDDGNRFVLLAGSGHVFKYLGELFHWKTGPQKRPDPRYLDLTGSDNPIDHLAVEKLDRGSGGKEQVFVSVLDVGSQLGMQLLTETSLSANQWGNAGSPIVAMSSHKLLPSEAVLKPLGQTQEGGSEATYLFALQLGLATTDHLIAAFGVGPSIDHAATTSYQYEDLSFTQCFGRQAGDVRRVEYPQAGDNTCSRKKLKSESDPMSIHQLHRCIALCFTTATCRVFTPNRTTSGTVTEFEGLFARWNSKQEERTRGARTEMPELDPGFRHQTFFPNGENGNLQQGGFKLADAVGVPIWIALGSARGIGDEIEGRADSTEASCFHNVHTRPIAEEDAAAASSRGPANGLPQDGKEPGGSSLPASDGVAFRPYLLYGRAMEVRGSGVSFRLHPGVCALIGAIDHKMREVIESEPPEAGQNVIEGYRASRKRMAPLLKSKCSFGSQSDFVAFDKPVFYLKDTQQD